MLQVIYFVIRGEAKFSKVRLEIFKCTWVKCFLETSLASGVKPMVSLINRFMCAHVRVAKEMKCQFRFCVDVRAENKNKSITCKFAYILDVFGCVAQDGK